MRTNRRRFLSLLGIGAASAPLAVKAAADAEIASLTGLQYRQGALALSGVVADDYGGATAASGQLIKGSYQSPYVGAHNYLKVWGKLPDFIEANVRERSKGVHALDYDIACKKSWSMAAKIHEQRKRNYDRMIEQYSVNGKHELAQNAFQKLTGFQWPW